MTLAVRLSPAGVTASSPAVVLDDGGFATAAWMQVVPGRVDLWGAHYDPSSGWQPAVLLEHSDTGSVDSSSDLAIALCGDNSVIVVWAQDNATQSSIWSARSRPDHSWDAALLVEAFSTNDASYPQVGCDEAGNAVAVWYQGDGSAWSVAANRYTPGQGWGTATYLEATNLQIYRPLVAVEPGGNATALWSQDDGLEYTVYANTYTVGTGWGAPVPVEQDNTQTAYAEAIGGGSGGRFVAVGQFQNGSQRSNWFSHFAPGSGWGPLHVFDPDARSQPEVRVRTGSDGRWMLAWLDFDENGTAQYMAGEVDPGAALANVSLIRHHNMSQPSFAAGESGGAVALWQESNGGRNEFVASRLTPGQGWSAPALVFSSAYHVGVQAAASINGAGDAVFLIESFVPLSSTDEVWAALLFEPYAPALALSAPVEGSVSALPSIRVSGTTEPGATVRANGVEAAVDSEGSFDALVPIKPGTNLITISATDARGNHAMAWVNVTHDDPVAGLVAQLAAANANVSGAQLVVSQWQARVAALEADANVTQADLDAARADLGAAQAQLSTLTATATALEADLDEALLRVATLEARLTDTSAAFNASQQRVDALEDRPTGGESGLALILAAVATAVGLAALGAAVVKGGRSGSPKPSPSEAGADRVNSPAPSSGGSDAVETSDADKRRPEQLSRDDR